MAKSAEILRPVSAVNQGAALASLFGAIAVLSFFKWFGSHDAEYCLVAVTIFIAIPHVGIQMLAWDSPLPHTRAWWRIGVKLWAQVGLFVCVSFVYFIFQGFFAGYLVPLRQFGGNLALLVVIVTPPYIWLTDQMMALPEDGLYQFGLCLLGKFRAVNLAVVRQYLLGWAVKGFFAPLMVGFALNDMRWFLEFPSTGGLQSNADIYEAAYRMLYFVDVLFGMTGYLCTFRLLNAQIRSTEPTMFGWVVCMLCYPPFWGVFSGNFLNYGEGGNSWGFWMSDYPRLWGLWAMLIMISILVYVWATVSFGIRFSNLTNRGTLTNGLYRWLKHPAYVSKNITWWLVSVPFLTSNGLATAIHNCVALALVNGVYYLRAKTEERHMMGDPDYVAYSVWMEQNSLYAKLKLLTRR